MSSWGSFIFIETAFAANSDKKLLSGLGLLTQNLEPGRMIKICLYKGLSN